ncbi:Auxilin-like protein 1 [Linum perenne]
MSEESDDPAKALYMSNGDFYETVDGSMEFNISYHKASQTSSGDMPNGTAHVAPLNNENHGYSVKVHKSDSVQHDDEYPTQLVSDAGHLDVDFNGEMLDGWHFGNTEKMLGASDSRPQKGYNKHISHPAQDFVTITALSLKTEPSHLPPPARPPPAVDAKMKNSDKLSPSHQITDSEHITRDCSPPYFDVEVDASSAAAASAAAMKDAMEKAQAKLKSAKESLERKREGIQRRAGSGSRTGRKDKEGKEKIVDQTRNTEDGNVNGTGEIEENGGEFFTITERHRLADEKEENGGEFFTLSERHKVKKTTNPISDSLQRERITVSPKTVGKEDRESVSSQGSDDIDEAGEWKEAGQFFELVREKSDQPSQKANNENIPLQNIGINGHENKGKKVVTEALEHQYGRKVKQDKSGSGADNYGEKIDLSKEIIGQKELQIAQEASRREDNDKRSRKHWQRPVEAEKKHARGDGFLRHHNVVEVQSNKSVLESKQPMKRREEELLPKWAGKILEEEMVENIEHLDEERSVKEELLEREANEKKQKEVQEREDKDRKRREALEMEENERRLKEDLERKEHERRLREAEEREKNERKLREAIQLEESERRSKEALEMEEIKMREAKAIEQAENEKREREATELAESEKRERETCQREENEKRLREAFEMEEEKERRSRDEAAKSGDNEKGRKEDLKREGTDEKINVTFEQEESVEEVVEQVMEETSEELNNVELLQKQEEEEKETNISKIHEVVDSETVGEAACQTAEHLVEESLECEEMFVKHEEFDDNGPEKGQNEAGEPQSVSYQHLGEDKKLEEAEVDSENPEVLGNEESEKAPSNLGLGEKLVAEAVDVLVDGRTEVSAVQHNVQPEEHHTLNTGRSEFPSEGNNLKREAQHDKQADSADIGSASSLVGEKFANDKVERRKNMYKEENKNDDISAKAVKESMEAGRKTGATQPVAPEVKGSTDRTGLRADASETMQSKVKKLNQSLPAEGVESARSKRERDIEIQRLRKMEEEWEREREREKDRMAVDRAVLESREKADRAAVERAMKEARERLEKACAEARGKSVSDKTSDSKLRAERAAVEKATAEARERAFERARAERLSAYGNNGLRQCSSFSDIKDSQFQNASSANGYRNAYSSVHSGTFNGRSEAVEGESAQRCKARLERYQRTAERAAKALAEKNMRDVQAQREQAERNRLAETLDAEIKRWSSGKEGNLRALLSTLQYILGQESGWQPIPLTDVITAAAVKRAYRKATLCVHPDKLQQRGASIHQKYICEKVFDLLKEAWRRFNSEER